MHNISAYENEQSNAVTIVKLRDLEILAKAIIDCSICVKDFINLGQNTLNRMS
ncbi:hypothetical protein WL278_03595 [Staphylococcus caprae]|uniref:hypothetical protein n=1 Tax=Staphylococcus TaxID=1279 RepID=UPI001559C1D4|nr:MULTISPECIES: hypothetical protein [Staphylococcus]MCI2954354.1 hypothetical protein [Staphylococcus caprae]